MKRLIRLVAWFLIVSLFLTIVAVCLKIPSVLSMMAQLSLSAALLSLWKYFLLILVCLVLISLLIMALNKTRLTAEQERERRDRKVPKELTRKGL